MFGLLDCNNFYASCETVFNPNLRGRAVVVLSNNDGCVIARSYAAKEMGIKMGVPAFQIKDLIDSGRVVVRSSNYTLYGDMSRRVMQILSQMVDDIEIYSIDEAFFVIPDGIDYVDMGRRIVDAIVMATGIPVSVGIAATKTLAKMANHAAKKYSGFRHVCVIDNDARRVAALKLTPIDDVWGIGRRYASRLQSRDVISAFDFTQLPRDLVRRIMTVGGEKTWCELKGISCIDLEQVAPDKQQICTSRSFGVMLETLDELNGPIATFAARCGAKLRRDKLVAGTVMPFLYTNRFRPDLPQCALHHVVALPHATNDTRVIVSAALDGLKVIYRPGFLYKKAGVIMGDIYPASRRPIDLFSETMDPSTDCFMSAIDSINQRFGPGTVKSAAELINQKWRPMAHSRSPNYTTDINDIIDIWCRD